MNSYRMPGVVQIAVWFFSLLNLQNVETIIKLILQKRKLREEIKYFLQGQIPNLMVVLGSGRKPVCSLRC